MLYNFRQATFYSIFIIFIALASCTVVKNYPQNKPFVFANKINLSGTLTKDEKKRLEIELLNYWDDSMKVNSVRTYGIKTEIRNPAVYDSASLDRSILFMGSYLTSQGYYNTAIIADTTRIDSTTQKPQKRAIVAVNINLQKNLSIDYISYDSILNPQLRHLALANAKESFLRKGIPFNNAIISSELDRLVTLFQRNGFYKFNRELIYAEVDTIDAALLEITLDPFEQAQKIAEATVRRNANPTIDVLLKLRPTADTTKLARYTTGNVYFYPETFIYLNPDSLQKASFKNVENVGNLSLKQNTAFIKMAPLREHTFLKKGSLYNEQRYLKTLNSLSALGPWSQVDGKLIERADSPYILDYHC